MNEQAEYKKPSDHPEFDNSVVSQIVELQNHFLTGAEIAAQLLAKGVAIVPAALAFMHLNYRVGIYNETSGQKALHVETAPGQMPPNLFAWSEFFLPKVIWDAVAAE